MKQGQRSAGTLVHRRLLGLMAVVSLAGAAGAGSALAQTSPADDCADLCLTATTCTIAATFDIVPGSTIDCSGRELTLTTFGVLRVTGGSFTLRAAKLTVNGSGGTITAIQGSTGYPGAVTVDVAGDFALAGKIRANGDKGGGRIAVMVGGNMTIPESGTDGIEALGLSTAGGGGRIDVDVTGSLTVNDPILADSGASGQIAGGQIRLRAGGDIVTDVDGHISAYGRSAGGGEIEIIAGGDVVLHEHLKAEGLGSVADGGQVEVTAGDFLNVAADISVMGGVNVGGGSANGGTVDLLSGCGGTQIGASINATGGQLGDDDLDSGRVEIDSRGSTTILTGVTIQTRALQAGGRAGSILVSARDLVDLQGTAKLDARGSTTSPGTGGDVQVKACRLLVASGSTIDVSGSIGGSIALRATQEPPATNGSQPQPLTIGSASILKAAGATNADSGRIELAPLQYKTGVCSNSGTTACLLDADCTIGCQAGDCNFANPDTAGLNTQFDVVPARQQENDFGECQATCE